MFAVFFGAGNLIFPPDVGFDAGTGWGAGLIFMLMYPVGICIAVLGIFCRFFNNDGIWNGMALMAVLIGVYDSAAITGSLLGFEIPKPLQTVYDVIPLSGQGFTWLAPALLPAVFSGP